MRWQDRNASTNIEDRRSRTGRAGLAIGGKGGLLILVVVMVAGLYGIDLTPLLGGDVPQTSQTRQYVPSAQEQTMAQFSAVALKTTEDAWETIFRSSGNDYSPPTLVLYSGVTQTTCGYGQAAMGPFYCPADQKVYLDLSFFEDMRTRLGGGGDFAQGYVIAHEVGHHVQHLLGIDAQVRRLQQNASQAQINRLSVMLELQADCFAGVWGRYVQRLGLMEPGDLEQALQTAQAIGDDRLQRQSSGRVVPDSFTHGTSQQRYEWFKRGFDTGDPNQCDTFSQLR